MTRMSVAELTLKKQIDRINHEMDTCLTERKAFDLQYDILLRQRDSLEIEYDRLADARRKASTQRKGPTP
jgi:BMFP domain-containing protein YqiC